MWASVHLFQRRIPMTVHSRADHSLRTVSRRRVLQTTGFLAAGTSLAAFSDEALATLESEASDNAPVTAVFGLVRREDLSHEEFVDYFHNTHIPLARNALDAARIDLQAYRSVIPVTPADSPYDGLGELTFVDLATFQQATATDRWDRVLADVPNFTQPDANAVIVEVEHDHLTSGN